MIRRVLAGAMPALACLVFTACGGPDEYRFEVHPTDGQVLRDGKPVAGAFVRFHPVDPSTVKIPEGEQGPEVMLTSETDQDGRFVMSTYLADDGIPAGDYVVTVRTSLAAVDVENSDGPRIPTAPPAPPADTIYADPATTTLKATVKPGENHFEFPLD